MSGRRTSGTSRPSLAVQVLAIFQKKRDVNQIPNFCGNSKLLRRSIFSTAGSFGFPCFF